MQHHKPAGLDRLMSAMAKRNDKVFPPWLTQRKDFQEVSCLVAVMSGYMKTTEVDAAAGPVFSCPNRHGSPNVDHVLE